MSDIQSIRYKLTLLKWEVKWFAYCDAEAFSWWIEFVSISISIQEDTI